MQQQATTPARAPAADVAPAAQAPQGAQGAQGARAAQAAQGAQAAQAAQATQAASAQGVPTTQAELNALRAKRSELADQQEALTDRRGELASQRERMGRQEGLGHESRIAVIDERSARIEQEIFQADQAIATALANGVATSGGEGQGGEATTTVPVNDQMVRNVRNAAESAVFESLMIAATVFVGATLAWRGFRRWIWKRKPAKTTVVPDQSVRLEQLQQSMDVIAIEVERISEAQRYVAKVINERIPALGAGEAQPVSMKEKDPVHLRADQRR